TTRITTPFCFLISNSAIRTRQLSLYNEMNECLSFKLYYVTTIYTIQNYKVFYVYSVSVKIKRVVREVGKERFGCVGWIHRSVASKCPIDRYKVECVRQGALDGTQNVVLPLLQGYVALMRSAAFSAIP